MACSTFIKTGLLVFGLLLIAAGVLLKWGLFPGIVKSMVVDQLQLNPQENEEIWETWVEPSSEIPVYMKFTFFNVTNPEEIKNGEKPSVQEIGPFAYRETRRKEGIQIVEDEIQYGSYIAYELDPSASCSQCDENTMITVINPALVGIVAMVKAIAAADTTGAGSLIESFVLNFLNDAITGTNDQFGSTYLDDLFTTQTANQETVLVLSL